MKEGNSGSERKSSKKKLVVKDDSAISKSSKSADQDATRGSLPENPSTGSYSDLDELKKMMDDSDSPKISTGATVALRLDFTREQEEERKKVEVLEKYKEETTRESDKLNAELYHKQKEAQKLITANEAMKKEMEDVMNKLKKMQHDIDHLKNDSNNSNNTKDANDDGDGLSDSGGASSDRVRSWSKKLVYSMQDMNIQLNTEREARKVLEQWKKEHEAEIEETKKKLRNEVDSRLRMEEMSKKMEREMSALINSP